MTDTVFSCRSSLTQKCVCSFCRPNLCLSVRCVTDSTWVLKSPAVEPSQCRLRGPAAPVCPALPLPLPSTFPSAAVHTSFLPSVLLRAPSCPRTWVEPWPPEWAPLPVLDPLLLAPGRWLSGDAVATSSQPRTWPAVAVVPIGAAGQLLFCRQRWLESDTHFSHSDKSASDTVFQRHVQSAGSSDVPAGLFPSQDGS